MLKFLEFSLSNFVSEGTGVITTVINFIVDNPLLSGLLAVTVVTPIVFSIISYVRSRMS